MEGCMSLDRFNMHQLLYTALDSNSRHAGYEYITLTIIVPQPYTENRGGNIEWSSSKFIDFLIRNILAAYVNARIVRVHYFVRGGFVGHRSRASSKASLLSSSGRRARFLGGQKGVALQLQDARVGVGSTKKSTRC
ncbi:hypothetical protein TNCV_2017211 [Trichonephila clavipes]|nr:hypothetical protein TNCV_2017211 [Trichonephila clavipes]